MHDMVISIIGMRFFIALEIPTENLASFKEIQDSLHTLIPQTRLTDLNKIHLTLAFLGEQDDSFKDKLIEVINRSVKDIPTFKITPAYIDGFPNIHNPNVFWVGVKDDIDKILLIRERIKDGLEALRLPVDERRFIPHISIAKINGDFKVSKDLEENLQKIMSNPPAGGFNPITISSIKLFESTPDEGFHKHNTLAEIMLTEAV